VVCTSPPITDGTNWAPANNGMTTNHVNSLAVFDTAIFAGTWSGEGIYRSTDDGMTWDTVNYNISDNAVNSIAVLDTNFFAGTHGGVIKSVDRGDNWTLIDNGPQDVVECFHVSDSNIFAGTYDGIYVSSDTGVSWSPVNTGLIGTTVNVFDRKDTFLFAGTQNSGLFRSADEGDTWFKTNLPTSNVTSLVISGQYIFTGTSLGVFRSSNNGDKWISVNLGLPHNAYTKALTVSGSNLFAGTESSGVFLSTDNGASWIPVNSGLTDMSVRCLAFRGTNLFAGTNNGAFFSSNYGTSWTPIDIGLTGSCTNDFAHNDEFFFAGTEGGLFRSADDGAEWIKTNIPYSTTLVVSGADIFTGHDWGMVNHSSNNGATYISFDLGLIKYPVTALGVSDTNLFAGMRGSGVWQRPLSEMNISDDIDFAPNDTACHGEIIPALIATGDSIKWYSNPDFTGLLHSGNIIFETGQIDNGTYTYYVTQLLNSIELKDTASLIISSIPIISSIEKTNKTTCDSDDGTITITATNENPLLYSINGGNNFYDNEGSFSALSNGNYTVVVMNSNGCEISGGIIEIINEGVIPPAPFAGKDTTYCIGDEIKDLYADASSGGTITWYSDPGINTIIGTGASYTPGNLTETTSFFMTETSNGCEGPSATVTITIKIVSPFEDEEICIVTIDQLDGRNLIVWEKTPDMGTAFYKLYREGNHIGTRAYNDLSIFKDTVADPENRPYLYYISVVDSCGNESDLSPYHKPHFLQYVGTVGGVNLSWDEYVVEGETVDFDSYTIYKGGDSTALSPFAENIPIVINVYKDTDPLALENRYFYRIAGELTTPCYPSGDEKAGTDPYNHSLSNLDDNRLQTFVEDISPKGGLMIYPNPMSSYTTIQFQNPSNDKYQLSVMDLSGKIVYYRDNIFNDMFEFSQGNLSQGLYLIELKGSIVYRGKIVIE